MILEMRPRECLHTLRIWPAHPWSMEPELFFTQSYLCGIVYAIKNKDPICSMFIHNSKEVFLYTLIEFLVTALIRVKFSKNVRSSHHTIYQNVWYCRGFLIISDGEYFRPYSEVIYGTYSFPDFLETAYTIIILFQLDNNLPNGIDHRTCL